jgi:hypothetical protein
MLRQVTKKKVVRLDCVESGLCPVECVVMASEWERSVMGGTCENE